MLLLASLSGMLGGAGACGEGSKGSGLQGAASGTNPAAAALPGTLSISVVGSDGASVTGYRWLLEKDLTYQVQPGVPDANTISVSFHRSYMPVVATGDAASPPGGLDPAQAYFLSVLPDAGYSMGGAKVEPGQTEVTVHLNKLPLPTAQITIFVFDDSAPLNNQPDLPNEVGLAGFKVILEDAGGRYGASGGHASMDAFGNPIGTQYNPDGSVAMMGKGFLLSDATGRVTVKNLTPAKYGIKVVPPPGTSWVQTSTIEGTRVIDAWVKPNEPGFFAEFGPPGYHASFGFVKPMNDTSVLSGGSSISGQVVNLHMSRLPGPYYNGAPLAHTTAWVGLNAGPVGAGRAVFAKKASSDGTFTIPNVPPGTYQLAIWDEALDFIFATHSVTVRPDGSCATPNNSCNLGQVPVFQWFTRLESYVFHDKNGNGLRDEGEKGIPNINVNLRWRDGTIYQAAATDMEGFVPFDQVFPFFAWLVAEVDNTRLRATGMTATVDAGGPIDPTEPRSFGGQLNPQVQPDGKPYRTEVGPVLTQAFQGFLGQTSVIEWGKKEHAPGENGGISGFVYYATTRAENDPRYAAAENWEPGIPGVTVNLYDKTGTTLLNTVKTDGWDDSLPTGCVGPTFVFRGQTKDCFDGLKIWNQVRPGVFDGSYAFTSYWPEGVGVGTEVAGLPAGEYVVEVVPPPGYEIVKEEDRNVDFGDSYTPSPMMLPPECVGPLHQVPDEFSLFQLRDEDGNPVRPFRHGEQSPLCTRKKVRLNDRQNAVADFPLFTVVPVSGHVIGFVLDDAANENDPNAPTFGEKFAPPWLPISLRDWTGREISRVYSDEYGVYNLLVPSTYTNDRPMPSGVAPNMLTVCLNSPAKPDPTAPGGYVLDPHYNPQYSQFCYTFQYMPGTTTYLDTPVLPQAAFAGPNQNPLDCELPSGTPRIYSVSGPQGGPFVSVANGTQTLTLLAPNAAGGGKLQVPNPAYDGTNAKTIERDYGFGPSGTVKLGNLTLPVVSWSAGMVVVRVPSGASTAQLSVTRADTQLSAVNAVTVTVGTAEPVYHLKPGEKIQQAIDAAAPATTILIPPGTYDELVVMWKPVRLQGWGEGSIINAVKAPAEKLQLWREKVKGLVLSNAVTLLPGQNKGFAPADIEPATLFDEEGPAIIVLAKDVNRNQGGFGRHPRGLPNARIDGLTITGGDSAGGIVVNGYARHLQISNNLITGNNGSFGGGIRSGSANLVVEQANGLRIPSAENTDMVLTRNRIIGNGGLGGAGGGISLYTGSDRYQVTHNFICGNFSAGDGGGIGHLGLSPDGRIANNTIIFNESFNQGVTVSGGGIAVSGAAPLADNPLSPGTGSLQILSNIVLGNSAGAGDGGGVLLRRVSGQDLDQGPKGVPKYRVDLINNMVTNNVAALAGGGISLQDSPLVNILHCVVSNNDSTATAGEAFAPGSPNRSTPQPAGIVARKHSPALLAALDPRRPGFSSPQLVNSIIRHNRSFYFTVDDVGFTTPYYALLPSPEAPPVYHDLAVLGTTGSLDPRSCVLGTGGYHSSNLVVDPQFVSEYFNGARGQTVAIPEVKTALQAPPAFDEGGNFIRVSFGPLTLVDTVTLQRIGDYHLKPGSPALSKGQTLTTPAAVLFDFDGDPRPSPAGTLPDIGADERP